MKPAIHLLDPVANQTMYKTMRCGYMRNPEWVEFTTNRAEVTCLKCKSYINNPYRVMRKYGRVKVVESFYVLLWADYGNKLDLVAVADVPGKWVVTMAFKNKIHTIEAIAANNMADLGFQLLKKYEREIINLKKSN